MQSGTVTWPGPGTVTWPKFLIIQDWIYIQQKKELCCHGDLDNSYPRQSTQNNPYSKQLEPRTTRSPDDLYLRQLVPKITCTQYNSYPGNKIITEYFENVFKQDSVTDVPDIKPQKLKKPSYPRSKIYHHETKKNHPNTGCDNVQTELI